jgi:hypothetical protein
MSRCPNCHSGLLPRCTLLPKTPSLTPRSAGNVTSSSVTLAVTYAIRGGVFHQATATLPVDPNCSGTTAVCEPSAGRVQRRPCWARPPQHAFAAAHNSPAAQLRLRTAQSIPSTLAPVMYPCLRQTIPAPGVDGPDPPPPLPSPPSPAPGGCPNTCGCAYGVDFDDSLCGYANTTLDVRDVQARPYGGGGGDRSHEGIGGRPEGEGWSTVPLAGA